MDEYKLNDGKLLVITPSCRIEIDVRGLFTSSYSSQTTIHVEPDGNHIGNFYLTAYSNGMSAEVDCRTGIAPATAPGGSDSEEE